MKILNILDRFFYKNYHFQLKRDPRHTVPDWQARSRAGSYMGLFLAFNFGTLMMYIHISDTSKLIITGVFVVIVFTFITYRYTFLRYDEKVIAKYKQPLGKEDEASSPWAGLYIVLTFLAFFLSIFILLFVH